MRLVVDTNIIISALIKDSVTRNLLTHIDAELYTIGFTKAEFSKYKKEIMKKAGINEEELQMIMDKIHNNLVMLDDNLISVRMNEAKKIMDKIDPDDTPFIAAALASKSAIWSDDKHFKKQKVVKVLNTKEIIDQTQPL